MKFLLLKFSLLALLSTSAFAIGISDISNIPHNEDPDYGDTYPPIKQTRAIFPSEDVIVLDFEGLRNNEYVNGFYNGGTGSKGSRGKNYGIYFSGYGYGIIGKKNGGTGTFTNEPSPITTLSTKSKNIILNAPKGIKNGISFWYSANRNLTITAYDKLEAKGSIVKKFSLKNLEELYPDAPQYGIWKTVGISFPSTVKSIDFSNIYNHAGIDNITLGSSIPVGRTKNSFTIAKPVISNVSTRADEFSIWLDISQDDTKPENLCDERIIKIKDSNGYGATQTGCTKTSLTPTIKNAIRYKFDFKINNIGDKQVYFENATVDLCQKADITMCATLSSIQDFTVYGTHFDMKEDAFSFKNTSWNKAVLGSSYQNMESKNDMAIAGNIISKYLPALKILDFWESVGYEEDGSDWFWDNKHGSDGLCYGMAVSAIANFNYKSDTKVWGTGELGKNGQNWEKEINDHWDIINMRAKPPYKPLVKQTASYLESNVQALKKIMYYFVGQSYYDPNGQYYQPFLDNSWVGKDSVRVQNTGTPKEEGARSFSFSDYADRLALKNILKNGSPIEISFQIDPEGGHAIVGTQYISYNDKDRWLLYDNNYPLAKTKKYNIAPYLQYLILNKFDYNINSSDNKENKHLQKISSKTGITYSVKAYKISSIYSKIYRYFNDSSEWKHIKPYKPDPQNIYKTRAVTTTSTSTPTIDYLLPNHAKVFLVGGKIQKVLDSSGKEVLLKPISQNTLQKGIAYILNDQTIYLPSSSIYKVYAKKVAGFPFLKVLLKVPNSDGTIEIANYENVQTSQADATEVSFYVGEGNTRKNIKRIGASDYKPDFDESFDLQVPPPTLFTGYVLNDEIHLQWQNPENPNFVKVIITKEAPSTKTIYEGTYEFTNDQIDYASSLEPVRYFIVSVDRNGNQSEKVYFELDTNKKYISGSVNNANIPHMGEPGIEGATLTLKNDQGEIIDTTQTNRYGMYVFPNMTNGTYIISIKHPGFTFEDKVVTIDGKSPYVSFSKPPIKHLDAYVPSVNTIGETSKIYWALNWTPSSNEQITIKINPDDKGWKTLTTTTKASKGYFEWKVTKPVAENVRVKVRLSSGYDVYDEKVVSVASPANSVSKKVKNDFNGDSISDIFWRSYAGENHIWLMHKDGSHKYFPKVTKPYEYELVGIGDFNGDGIADIFWRKDTHNYLWLMHKDGSHTHILQADKPRDYLVAGIGDFNGDGKDDILWRNIDGVSLWYMNADGSHKYFRKVNKPLEFRVEGIGDFNGDGIDDIFWKRGKGNYVWFMRADGTHKYMSLVPKPVEYVVAGVGDFNGDGKDDIFWRNDKGTSIWYMNKDGSHKYLRKVDKPLEYKVVKVGDFNADGIDDIFWRKGSENGLWFMNQNGTHKWKAIKAKPSEFRVYPVYDYDMMQYYQYLWEVYN